jgi:hypothetical protein
LKQDFFTYFNFIFFTYKKGTDSFEAEWGGELLPQQDLGAGGGGTARWGRGRGWYNSFPPRLVAMPICEIQSRWLIIKIILNVHRSTILFYA